MSGEFPPACPFVSHLKSYKLGSALLMFQSSDVYHAFFHNKTLARTWSEQIASGIYGSHS